MKKKILLTGLCLLLAVAVCAPGVSAATVFSRHAAVPYDTYTYWETSDGFTPVYAKPMYEIERTVDYKDIGVEKFGNLADVSVAPDGTVCLLDSALSRLVILNKDYSLKKEIRDFDGEAFVGAQGVLAYSDDTVYVADTEQARVLVGTYDGKLKKIITLPQSTLIPDDFSFRPIQLAVDRSGYTYILSDGSYYGALLCAPDGEFLGFFGANTVKQGLTQALKNLWDKLTMTNEKRSKQASKLPFQFTDLYVDRENFIYTATGRTEGSELQTGVIKRLSPGGINILPSEDVVFGEQQVATAGNAHYSIPLQDMQGLCVDDNGFIYTYDTGYGRIYIYDAMCRMVQAFGGGLSYGLQEGTFQQITAIDLTGDTVLATDGVKNDLTVFRCTEYGKLVKKLQKMTLDGDYLAAEEGWKQVSALDAHNQFAYVGLAKAAYTAEDYRRSMELAETAYDRETYAQAFQMVRKDFLHRYFGWIVGIAVVVIAAIALLLHYKKKKGIVLMHDRRTVLFWKTAFHPAQAFTEIKQKKLTSMKWAWIALALFYLSSAIQSMFGSFVFVSKGAGSFNSILLLVQTVGFVLLWTITNWAVCTLFGGIGKLREIFAVIAYSLMPMIVGNVLYTIITNFLVPDEAAFLSVITVALTLYSVLLVIIGTIIVHDFSFGRFVGTTLLTFFGMAIVIAVGIIIVILVQQLVAFFATIGGELIYK